MPRCFHGEECVYSLEAILFIEKAAFLSCPLKKWFCSFRSVFISLLLLCWPQYHLSQCHSSHKAIRIEDFALYAKKWFVDSKYPLEKCFNYSCLLDKLVSYHDARQLSTDMSTFTQVLGTTSVDASPDKSNGVGQTYYKMYLYMPTLLSP